MEEKHQVIIIGGGLAGLRAAQELERHQVPYLLVEKSRQLGGRVASEEVDGFTLDVGFQVYLSSYEEGRRTTGIDTLNFESFEPGAIIHQRDRTFKMVDPRRRPSSLLASAFAPVGTFKDKALIARLSTFPPSPQSQKGKTTLESLRDFGFSTKVIENFFRPFFSGVLLEDQLMSNAAFFWKYWKHFSKGDACLPDGGMGSIPQVMSESLRNGDIVTNCEVRSIDNGCAKLSTGEQLTPSCIIMACDPDSARKLLESRKKRVSSHWKSTTCLYFKVKGLDHLGRTLFVNASGKGRINTLCLPSRANETYAPAGKNLLSVSLHSIPDIDDQTLTEEIAREIKGHFKEFKVSLSPLKVYRIKKALPEMNNQKMKSNDRNIILAGDYTEDPSIDGALKSGRRAGEKVMRALQSRRA